MENSEEWFPRLRISIKSVFLTLKSIIVIFIDKDNMCSNLGINMQHYR